jgi:hypothetical protein
MTSWRAWLHPARCFGVNVLKQDLAALANKSKRFLEFKANGLPEVRSVVPVLQGPTFPQ